ncbi:MAG: hypothetical protein NC311_10060 [Muribaculaceae bacterium]|nr:hypothetical protein [Muribaculaceae bacterium]
MPDDVTLKKWLEKYGPAETSLAGQPCWGLSYGSSQGFKTFPGHITKAGREYLTTDIFRDSRFRAVSMDLDYLVEADSNGLVHKLFLFEEDKDAYIEREGLADLFSSRSGQYRSHATASQLKTAMAVFEHASGPTCERIMAMIRREEGAENL